MEVINGKIRIVTGGIEDDVVEGKTHSVKELGSEVPTSNKLEGNNGLQNSDYYLIYLNDGNIYLIQFKKGKNSVAWALWPKSYTYWRAKEHP